MTQEDKERRPEAIELPAPTFWPMVLAFGIALVMAGLMTHVVVSIAGLIITARAAVGWWREVIPHERHETVPLRRHELRASPVKTSGRTVAQLKAGEDQHRVRIPERIHPYSAGLWGGLAGGTAMAVLACLYGQFVVGSIWYPVNLLAAVAIPSLAQASLAQLKAFDATAFIAALVCHGILSLLVGMLYAVTLPMFPKWAPVWAGVLAPLFWSGGIAALLDLINPLLNERINWPWFVVCQLGFGLVGGFVIARTHRIETMQTWPFAARAAIEAPGLMTPRRPEEHK